MKKGEMVYRSELDIISNNELSTGIKIVYSDLICNFCGYCKEEDVIIVSSMVYIVDFKLGKDFDHDILIDLVWCEKKLDVIDSRYYKKIKINQVEDVYIIDHYPTYMGITCQIGVLMSGSVKVVINSKYVTPQNKDKLLSCGFVVRNVESSPGYIEKEFCNDSILIDDSNLIIDVIKKYPRKFHYPLNNSKGKFSGVNFLLDIDVKTAYKYLIENKIEEINCKWVKIG